MNKISVTYYQRKPGAGHWSIEYIFENLRFFLKTQIQSRVKIARFSSNGFVRRLYITIEAIFFQSDINHITGDIHFVAFLLKKSKTILTIHDCGILRNSSGFKHKVYYYFWYYLPCKCVRYITVVSEYSKKELMGYLPFLKEHKVFVIPSAVADQYTYVYKEFNTAKPTLLQIGTAHNKNLLVLIKAIHKLSCKLIIVGVLTPEQISCLITYEIEYVSLQNLNYDQIRNLYVEADMLSFVSTFEGFGMPIIEANRTGRVVITSNCASMPEVASDAACIVDPFDSDSIRGGIIKIIQDKKYRDDLINKGLKNATRYDNAVIAEKYYDLYQKIKGT